MTINTRNMTQFFYLQSKIQHIQRKYLDKAYLISYISYSF